jgi:hypothetical protein
MLVFRQSEEELKLACDLISHLVPGALQKLQSLTGNAKYIHLALYTSDPFATDLTAPVHTRSALSKDELWVVLQLVRSVVRGAATILPQEKGSYEPREQWDTELPHHEQPPSITYPSQLWRGIEARNGQVRGEISKALSAASGAFKTARADDITSLAKLIKVMNLVLNFNGISQQKLHWLKMIYKGTKRRYAKKLETAEDKQGTTAHSRHSRPRVTGTDRCLCGACRHDGHRRGSGEGEAGEAALPPPPH